ncbi:histidine phosphatase family protein [Paenibacillus sp. 7124]|uniref:Histidine phosphatase family protein n=1 Tax=Paenibacillus apii TaxID=1850370 RepID=A0A6M1PMY9_9BACL|nr:histidine phosphatase family protein [Paenibacillus apii]NGM83828.1 histidine phosphatase family protein [Paenibacillus apii]NJJ40643.1 histidine phosphatase family protein [Paenibacillus apii]
MTNLYFVRHAHSIYSADELNRPLSERGKADAGKVTELLKNECISVLISSPYKRAIQTIEGLADIIGVDIAIEEDFRERLLAENPVDDFEHAVAKVWEDDSFSWEGGESNMVAQKRGVRALEDVLERYEGKNIAIGTHGNIMVLMMNYFDKRFDYTFWKQLDMPDIYKLSFDNLRLSEVKRIWDRS